MDCRSARDALMDQLVERTPDALAGELARHLETCAECRREADAIEAIWTDLGRLDVKLPDDARMNEIRDALVSGAAAPITSLETATQPSSHWPGRRRVTLVAALGGALAAGFLLGFVSGQYRGPAQSSAPAVQPSPRFLLLLHEAEAATPIAAAESRARVAEYAAWARSLYAEGRLVMAEKLGDEPGTWLPAGAPAVDDVVSGFFLIVAEDAADALAVARASPHLKYGGRIEIRRIEET